MHAPALYGGIIRPWRRLGDGCSLGPESTVPPRDAPLGEDSDEPAERLGRGADRVASMIVTSSCSDLECAVAERELRMECLSLLPERMELFDRIYASRFRRLREQFR
jgi:hypothetical protein